MTTPLPFEKMYEDANVWTNEVASKLGHENRQVAYHAIRGVLFALRDRIPADAAFHLSAQLPTVLRGVFFEGYTPAGKPEKYDRAGFMQHVNSELKTVNGESPERATEAVFAVLANQVSPGAFDKIRRVLPEDLKPGPSD